MSSFIYAATSLTGGAAGALDKIDGVDLADGDGAIVIVPGDSCYFYILDVDSAEVESSPAIIKPDMNSGDKRWIQIGVSGAVAFATWQEIASGVITNKAVAPAQLEDSGVLAPPFATAAEILQGTVSKKTIAPDQLKAANIIPVVFANAAEIAAGTEAAKAIAPDQLASATAATGTGKVVRATSPVLITPNIGNATGNISGNAATATKTIPRITTITTHATPTINTDNCDAVTITALAEAITSMTTNLSGTPVNFQKLIFRIKDNGTARAIAWGAKFVAKGATLPTTTVLSKLLTVGFIYDTVLNTWGCVAACCEV